MTDGDSMTTNNLCDSAKGTFVTLDDYLPLTEDKPWKNEGLRKLEEAQPRLKEGKFEKISRWYKAKTGVGCDGFHPKGPPDFTKETR